MRYCRRQSVGPEINSLMGSVYERGGLGEERGKDGDASGIVAG